MIDLASLVLVLTTCSIPGAFGGLGTFLFSLRKGHYKNNRYTKKLSIEIIGATVLASFVGPLFPDDKQVFASFAIGLMWVGIIQVSRSKITKIVKAVIGEELQ